MARKPIPDYTPSNLWCALRILETPDRYRGLPVIWARMIVERYGKSDMIIGNEFRNGPSSQPGLEQAGDVLRVERQLPMFGV